MNTITPDKQTTVKEIVDEMVLEWELQYKDQKRVATSKVWLTNKITQHTQAIRAEVLDDLLEKGLFDNEHHYEKVKEAVEDYKKKLSQQTP